MNFLFKEQLDNQDIDYDYSSLYLKHNILSIEHYWIYILKKMKFNDPMISIEQLAKDISNNRFIQDFYETNIFIEKAQLEYSLKKKGCLPKIKYFEDIAKLDDFVKKWIEIRKKSFEQNIKSVKAQEIISELTIDSLSKYIFIDTDDFINLLIEAADIYPNKKCIQEIKDIITQIVDEYASWTNDYLHSKFNINKKCDVEKIIIILNKIKSKIGQQLIKMSRKRPNTEDITLSRKRSKSDLPSPPSSALPASTPSSTKKLSAPSTPLAASAPSTPLAASTPLPSSIPPSSALPVSTPLAQSQSPVSTPLDQSQSPVSTPLAQSLENLPKEELKLLPDKLNIKDLYKFYINVESNKKKDDLNEEEKNEEEKNEDDDYVYHDSDDSVHGDDGDDGDDDDDDSGDSGYNKIWKKNKKFIEHIIGQKGLSKNLIFYGKNLILYYQNKIASIKKLLESKGMDNTKNFVADITIQNEQIDKIKDIKNNSLIQKTETERLNNMFKNYYELIGNHAKEVMDKDYENRHKTIMYDLLIKEYELNIEQINKSLNNITVIQQSIDTEITDEEQDLLSLFNDQDNLFINQKGGEDNSVMNYEKQSNFDIFLEKFNHIQNDIITHPYTISLLFEFLYKIKFADYDQTIITEKYFNLSDLRSLFIEKIKSNKKGYLVGGKPEISMTGQQVVQTVIDNMGWSEDINNNFRKIPDPPNGNVLQNWTEQDAINWIDSYYISDENEKKRAAKFMIDTFAQKKDENEGTNEEKIVDIIDEIEKDIDEKNKEIEDIKSSKKDTDDKEKKIQLAYDKMIINIKEKSESLMKYFEGQLISINDEQGTMIKDFKKMQKDIIDIEKQGQKDKKKNEQDTLDKLFLEYNKQKCEKKAIYVENKKNLTTTDAENEFFKKYNIQKQSPKEQFYDNYISNNFLKKNLHNFILECKKLDSIPAWRANISQLIVGYLSKYMDDPNSFEPNNTTYITVMPTYDIFNIIIMGTPGVGKSFTADIIGKVLKYSGLLTKGDRHDIKKPDIVGSYTGQTAPKVYKEFTECLGKVIFIDEAYSIAGAKDETKGTYNEFGQESLDALTDYTSEHIGFSAFVAAGYEYEMNTQFLEVNIGLPRRFPTQLILKRYALNSFWLILHNYLIKFIKKKHLENHHKACFELLNLLFNFQCGRNPTIQLPKNWVTTWKSHTIKNIHVNLEINVGNKNKIPIPFLELVDFDKLVRNTDNNVTSESVIECISREFLNKANTLTKTFIKSYVLYNFCEIINGDLFRSQADNLTKFSNYIFDDKITNNSNKYNEKKDKQFEFGDTDWIENCYFNLYFTKNPNYRINNINYEFNEIDYDKTNLKGDLITLTLNGGKRKINKISKNNKKTINRRSKRKQFISIVDRLLQKMNNKVKIGGKPTKQTPRLPIEFEVPESDFLIPYEDSDSDPESDSEIEKKEKTEYTQKLSNNFEADKYFENGKLFYEMQQKEEATKYFLKAITISNIHADSYHYLGLLNYNDIAINWYYNAAMYQSIEANYYLGYIFYYTNKIHTGAYNDSEVVTIKDNIKQQCNIDLDVDLNQDEKNYSEEKYIKYFTKVINTQSCTLPNYCIEFATLKLVEYYLNNNIEEEVDESKLAKIRNEDIAIEYLLKLTKTSSLANNILAEIYTKRKDIDNALKYYNESANLGDFEIQIILGDYYNVHNIKLSFYNKLFEFKNKENMDILKSIKYYKMAKDKLVEPALLQKYNVQVSDIFQKYNDVKRKYENDIYQKLLISNEEKDKIQQFNIGKKIYNGEDDYNQNIEYGINLIKKSAGNKYPEGAFYYAKILYGILPNLIEINNSNYYKDSKVIDLFKEIEQNLQIASDANFIDAIYFYADILFHGIKIIPNKEKAVNLYKKGTELGDIRCQLFYAKLLINLHEDYYNAITYLINSENTNNDESSKIIEALYLEQKGMKNLDFKIDINFTDIQNINDIIADISQYLKDDKLKDIFINYIEHFNIYKLAHGNQQNSDKFETTNFKYFIYIYILLLCYSEAISQSQNVDQKFNKESWWFFRQNDFITILNDFDIKSIMNLYDKKVGAAI